MDLGKEFLEIKAELQNIIAELQEMREIRLETQKTSELPHLLKIKEVCAMLGMTEQGLAKKRKKGEIRTVATGRRVYVEKAEFERFLASLPTANKSNRPLKNKKK